MGSAIARNLLRAALQVTVWNRTRAKAEALATDGATVADTPAEAAGAADVALTMLADWEAVEVAMTGPDGGLAGMRRGTIWLQMSTIGVEATRRAARLAEPAQVVLVDAPVLGTKEPAEQGELVVLASGPERETDACSPIFEAIGNKTVRLDEEPGRGSAFKLVVNTWLIGLVEALSETIALARALDFDPRLFLETISGGPVDVPYAQLKGRMMVEEAFPTSFPVRHAHKDAALVLDAAREHALNLPGLEAALHELEQAQERGHGDEDLAAVVTALRPGVEQRA
jgi:3-hydroxyisobutyrate dehydrogenase